MNRLSREFYIQAVFFAFAAFIFELCTGLSLNIHPPLIKDSFNIPPDETNVTRIIGGVNASPGDFPYLVSIQKNEPNRYHACGGTLLPSRRHILTAAHCLTNPNPVYSTISIIFNTIHLDKLDGGSFTRKVINHRVHENYDPNTFEHDIGIMLLDNPVDEQFSTVTLESSSALSQSYAGQQAVIAGWGRTKQVLYPGNKMYAGNPSNIMKKANTTIMDNTDCGIRHHEKSVLQSILLYTKPTQFVCALSYADEETCQGDSGGPLFINGVQTGVVSNSLACADPRFPGMYARVGFYIDWINEKMRTLV